MAFSSFLKIFALLALLTVDVNVANADQARSLRIEPATDNVEKPVSRRLTPNPGVWSKLFSVFKSASPAYVKMYQNAKLAVKIADNNRNVAKKGPPRH